MTTLFMETTEISPERTVEEIHSILRKSGARQVMMEYDGMGGIAAVAFTYRVGANDTPFRLPCRWEAIFAVLRKRAGVTDSNLQYMNKSRRAAMEDKAKRVAWRQILRWIQAQLALVDTSMVKIEEVFLPYMQLEGGRTVFEISQERGFASLALEYKGGS